MGALGRGVPVATSCAAPATSVDVRGFPGGHHAALGRVALGTIHAARGFGGGVFLVHGFCRSSSLSALSLSKGGLPPGRKDHQVSESFRAGGGEDAGGVGLAELAFDHGLPGNPPSFESPEGGRARTWLDGASPLKQADDVVLLFFELGLERVVLGAQLQDLVELGLGDGRGQAVGVLRGLVGQGWGLLGRGGSCCRLSQVTMICCRVRRTWTSAAWGFQAAGARMRTCVPAKEPELMRCVYLALPTALPRSDCSLFS